MGWGGKDAGDALEVRACRGKLHKQSNPNLSLSGVRNMKVSNEMHTHKVRAKNQLRLYCRAITWERGGQS